MNLRLLTVPVLLLCAVGFAQDRTPGLPDKDILAMGRQKWFDYYTTKHGSSTAACCDAEEFFGRALMRRNDAALKKASASKWGAITQLRKEWKIQGGEMGEVAWLRAGGGTIWSQISAGFLADIEEVVAMLLTGVQRGIPARKTSDVTKAYDRASKDIERLKGDIEITEKGGSNRARQALAKSRASSAKCIKVAAKMSRRESDAILDLCVKFAEIQFVLD